MTVADTRVPTQSDPTAVCIDRLRTLAVRGLARMYRPEQRLFAHHAQRTDAGIVLVGSSARYTAIVLIGLAGESEITTQAVLQGDRLERVCDRLLQASQSTGFTNLGDVALAYWAAWATGHRRADAVLPKLGDLLRHAERSATVELAWALAGLCAGVQSNYVVELRDEAARRLLQTRHERSALFAHQAGAAGARLRGHVACFADLVYPIHALAGYYQVTCEGEALRVANRCAECMCGLLGPAGQWWWHYDVRTGRVVERYPVYAVHQDAMGPMALSALAAAGGDQHGDAIARGLAWLESAPELGGGSLIDESTGVIWRKVGRHEPGKLVRRAQAAAARVHPTLRCPGVDTLFPAGVIDDECRPYHLGWLLYAWPARQAQPATPRT